MALKENICQNGSQFVIKTTKSIINCNPILSERAEKSVIGCKILRFRGEFVVSRNDIMF